MGLCDLKVTPEQQYVLTKIKNGTILTKKDYLVIVEDVKNKFGSDVTKITEDIDKYIRGRYFSGYNKEKVEKYLAEMI